MFTLKKVSKYFDDGGKIRQVLSDVSYVFEQGRRYLITGPSGAGKSTLLLLLAGLEMPTQGQLFWGAYDLAKQSGKFHAQFLSESVGLVFQSASLIPECSVLENCMIKGLGVGMPQRECVEWGMELLELVGLASFAQGNPLHLSGGEQQRLAVARALFLRPLFLLADEPIAHLDEASSNKILELFSLFHKRYGMGIVVSSHDPFMFTGVDEVVSLVDHRLVGVDKVGVKPKGE